MTDYSTGLSEKEHEHGHEGLPAALEGSHEQHNQHHNNQHHDALGHFSATLLESGDSLIYSIVGICFFVGSLVALGYSFWNFGNSVFVPDLTPSILATAIINLVSDLLLVLIIMEVLGTVIHYLKSHATSLRPFLFIGIVSATRGILSIGARLSIESIQGIKSEEFNRAMIELGVNAAAILALGITLKLLGRLAQE